MRMYTLCPIGYNAYMGRIEEEVARRVRKGEIQRLVLESVKIGGLLAIAVVAPNVVGAMAKLGIIRSPRQSALVERSCRRLVRSGQLMWKGNFLRITPKGEAVLRRLKLMEMKNQKPRKWDKKWRMLLFDIPEYRAGLRAKVRRTLHEIGFVHLQHSAWVYPYDCEDLITLLKVDFKIGYDVLYIVADVIEHDAPLRRQFGLARK